MRTPRSNGRLLAAGLLAAGAAVAACGQGSTDPSRTTSLGLLADAFTSPTPGTEAMPTTYNADGSAGTWAPDRGRGGPGGPGGPGGGEDRGPGFGGMMGGGIGGDFLGGGFGPGFGRGPFGQYNLPSNCTFDSGAGRVTCPAETHDSLTIVRTAAFKTTAGVAQAKFDTLTNSANLHVTVSGSVSFAAGDRRGFGHGFGPPPAGGRGDSVLTARTSINSVSDRTVTGLAAGATQRTVDEWSSSQESTTGTTSAGTFVSLRLQDDTTRGLVLPVKASGESYPTAGTVIRTMSGRVTFSGQSAVQVSRREVVTYDGSATAKVVITQDGTTKNCTQPLPRGRLSCS